MDWNFFGRSFGDLRRKYGLRQKQVAYNGGVSPSYVASLEGGRRPPPGDDGLQKIIAALGATEDEKAHLVRASCLTQIARVIHGHSEMFPAASAAISLLEISPQMSPAEVSAIQSLVEGYRFRTLLPQRKE
ncbi:helix-turn-helix transcriptional regulator [Uliginosibacterium sp. H3]|uniref:Helix-turn-helix transcriptional regulator n=1 Tax=Uliginosibacterium silvisoli TaxID=3114758 RepID=A0ABU6K6U2_9RHOO|nr:helix-turn-helix transcriptional regulator [Uliginosibacterium sp. H3]